MTDLDRVKEWLQFAHWDLQSAQVLFKEKIYHEVCFHAQQCVEKALKAWLVYKGEAVPKIHGLASLLKAAARHDPALKDFREICLVLDQYYVPTRYPEAVIGSKPTGLPNRKEAEEALDLAESFFGDLKKKIR